MLRECVNANLWPWNWSFRADLSNKSPFTRSSTGKVVTISQAAPGPSLRQPSLAILENVLTSKVRQQVATGTHLKRKGNLRINSKRLRDTATHGRLAQSPSAPDHGKPNSSSSFPVPEGVWRDAIIPNQPPPPPTPPPSGWIRSLVESAFEEKQRSSL